MKMSRPDVSKPLDILSHIVRVAQDLTALAILSDSNVRRSAVEQENLNNTGNHKKGHTFWGVRQAYYFLVYLRF